jgi:hypothetical protein
MEGKSARYNRMLHRKEKTRGRRRERTTIRERETGMPVKWKD